MGSLAIQRLESLLESRKLDHTVADRRLLPASRVLPTGVDVIDSTLGGGWLYGEVSEVTGARSTGRTAVLVATLAAAIDRGGIAGLVDAFDRFDPVSAAAVGLDLNRVLWVRGPAVTLESHGAPASGRGRSLAQIDLAVHNAIRALDLIVRAGGFAVAALDLADVPVRYLRRLPFTTWLRLAHANEGHETVCLIAADAPVGRSARGVSLRLDAVRSWDGTSAQSRRFAGFAITPHAAAGRPHPLAGSVGSQVKPGPCGLRRGA